MSEWFTIKDQEDVEISEDGKTVEVLFNTNEFGNQYVEVPVKFILSVLESFTPARKEIKSTRPWRNI